MADVGRPLKFQTVMELEEKIFGDFGYFKTTLQEEWSITGLAVWLETSRRVLMEYEDRDEFSNTIKRAKCKIEAEYERRGWTGKVPAFAIFALKNFDWRDKSDHALTDGEGKPLNMAPQISMIDFDSYLQSQHANTETKLEGLQRSTVDQTDSGESQAN